MDQVFLINDEILRREVLYADISEKDIVLEIGAGVGNLTRFIAERAKKVIAVEKDRYLVKILRDVLKEFDNVEIVEGDILKIKVPKFNKVVSNIPFSISSEITEYLMLNGFELAVILYQKEFAERLVAKPCSKNYSRITILVNLFSKVELLEIVSKKNFFPIPEIDSAIVRFEYKRRDYDFDVNDFLSFIRDIFIHKKKKLRKVLKNYGYNLEKISEDFLNKRICCLSLEDLITIYRSFKK